MRGNPEFIREVKSNWIATPEDRLAMTGADLSVTPAQAAISLKHLKPKPTIVVIPAQAGIQFTAIAVSEILIAAKKRSVGLPDQVGW